MPEGDTIFRTATSLRRWLTGRRVTEATSSVGGIDARRLIDRRVEGVNALGKHLLIHFSGDLVVHSHMRMTGSWHVYPTGERWRRPAGQARLVLEAGARSAICFNAPVVELLAARDVARHPVLRRLGPDLLVPGAADRFVGARARARVRASPTVGELLLDQQVMAGIGNLYRCETLFLCALDPWTPSLAVSDGTLDELMGTASRLMAANATAGNGIRRFDGPAGLTWVYRRGGLTCRRCGTVVARAMLGRQARSLYWCPGCQPTSAAGR